MASDAVAIAQTLLGRDPHINRGAVANAYVLSIVGIRAARRLGGHVPLRGSSVLPTTNESAFFGRDRFTYQAERDVYRCPGGQELRFRKHKCTERVRLYQAPAATCNACPLKPRCTASAQGRQLKRGFNEAYLDWVRGYHATEPYAKAMGKRQVWVEPLFAEAKAWHGLSRFRLRGLPKVNGEALLIVAG
ncbi:MAG: transposase [Chloroflexota bacterium]|nr:transposase [Chloroflexota bacterium]